MNHKCISYVMLPLIALATSATTIHAMKLKKAVMSYAKFINPSKFGTNKKYYSPIKPTNNQSDFLIPAQTILKKLSPQDQFKVQFYLEHFPKIQHSDRIKLIKNLYEKLSQEEKKQVDAFYEKLQTLSKKERIEVFSNLRILLEKTQSKESSNSAFNQKTIMIILLLELMALLLGFYCLDLQYFMPDEIRGLQTSP